MSALSIRTPAAGERNAIAGVVEAAFGQTEEAVLVERLVADGDVVLEMVAERGGRIVGHILFSRMIVDDASRRFAAVALAPLSVEPASQNGGVGSALVEAAHRALKSSGERLSVVVGDPAYYGRFGYARQRAASFESDYQGEALQALAWGEAPTRGRLLYAAAFGAL